MFFRRFANRLCSLLPRDDLLRPVPTLLLECVRIFSYCLFFFLTYSLRPIFSVVIHAFPIGSADFVYPVFSSMKPLATVSCVVLCEYSVPFPSPPPHPSVLPRSSVTPRLLSTVTQDDTLQTCSDLT